MVWRFEISARLMGPLVFVEGQIQHGGHGISAFGSQPHSVISGLRNLLNYQIPK